MVYVLMATYSNLNDLSTVVTNKIADYLGMEDMNINTAMKSDIADIVYHHVQRFVNEQVQASLRSEREFPHSKDSMGQ